MVNLFLGRAWWPLVIAAGLASLLVLVVLVGCQFLNRDRDGLDEIQREQAVQLVYPQATKLHHTESPKRSNPLEGVKTGPRIVDIYGVNASDQEVMAFYRQRLEELGWKVTGTAEGSLHTYRRLIFDKGELRAEIRFWYREDFQDQYPSINIDGFTTIYDLLIFGPPD